MAYIRSININTSKAHPFPYDILAIKYARNIALSNQITFFIGDNGKGKSTLLETMAFRLQLPKMDGAAYPKRSFEAAMKLSSELELEFAIDNPRGFFFRFWQLPAECSANRQYASFPDEVPGRRSSGLYYPGNEG